MSEQAGPSAYDRWHESLGVNDGADDPWYQLVRQELDLTRDIGGRRVLEIGCGRGGFACWLATRTPPPAEVVAVDYSSVAVEKGRAHAVARGVSGISWATGDIQAIDQADASCDSVFSCETIEHVPDPIKAVSELARILKPGGRLFLTAPNYLGPLGLYRGYLRLRGRRFAEVGQPINQFTLLPRTLLWLRRAGLDIEAIRGVGHYLPVPGRSPIRMQWLDKSPMKWFALHAMTVARKPQ